MSGRLVALALVAALSTAASAQKPDVLSHRSGLWSLAPAGGMERWVEVHDLDEARTSGVFHLEVLGRRAGDAAWKVEHLLPHLAITRAALERSIVKPLATGSVYPETFKDAHDRWRRAEQAGERPFVCDTTVDDCLRSPRR